jgi:hypothetical protein
MHIIDRVDCTLVQFLLDLLSLLCFSLFTGLVLLPVEKNTAYRVEIRTEKQILRFIHILQFSLYMYLICIYKLIHNF